MLEVADIFRLHGEAYRQKYARCLRPRHRRAMAAIERCRTAALGGQLRECERCAHRVYRYHSCKNRHCPECHGEKTRRWLERQRTRLLLGCPYYLLTFTLPGELRALCRSHPKVLYPLLMRSAAAAIEKLARDPRYLGAQPGALAVLHTWTRAMLFHPHVHVLVPAGGLSADATTWVNAKNPAFLLPVRALSVIFRAKVRDRLKRAGLFALAPKSAWTKPWVVHCQHAGSGEKVLDYLGRYVFRIAITNSRLEAITDDGHIRFRYRDNKTRELRTVTLAAEDFIARFLEHVLPRGLTKVRYYGLFSASCRDRLEQARRLLGAEPVRSASTDTEQSSPPPHNADSETALPTTADRCPACGVGRLLFVELISPARGRPP